MPEKEITLEINPGLILLLAFSLVVLILNLQVTFGTPINFGDEGFHSHLAQYMAENREFPIWLSVIEGTKLESGGYTRPPLWNLVEASFFLLLGFQEFIIRFLTPFIAFLTGLATYILVKRLFDQKIGLISAIFLITLPSLVTYSVLFYTDMLFTFYSALFFFTFLLYTKENRRKYLFLSAIFAALAAFTKAPGYAYYLFFGLEFLYEIFKTKSFATLKKYLLVLAILLLVQAGFYVRNFYYYKNPTCYSIPYLKIFPMESCGIDKWQDKYQFAGRTVEEATEASVYKMGIMSYLAFAYGSLPLVVLGFLIGLLLLSKEGGEMLKHILLYLLLFLAVFYISTGRAEDTARHTLAWAPLITTIAAIFFGKTYEIFSSYYKYLGLIVIILIILLAYQNFKVKLDTMATVKQFSPTFFEACNWVKAHPEEVPEDAILMTIWAHRAIYNCQRIAAGNMPDIALSRDLNYTLEVAKSHGITHLFIQKFSIDPTNSHLAERYDLEFVQFLENNPQNFQKIYENGPPLQDCQQYWQRGYSCDGNIIYKIVY